MMTLRRFMTVIKRKLGDMVQGLCGDVTEERLDSAVHLALYQHRVK